MVSAWPTTLPRDTSPMDWDIMEDRYPVKLSIYTSAFSSATMAAASILAKITDSRDTGADSRVSRVLSIFSVEIAPIIIWEVYITSMNTTMGISMFCMDRKPTSVELLICALLSDTTVISLGVTGCCALAACAGVMPDCSISFWVSRVLMAWSPPDRESTALLATDALFTTLTVSSCAGFSP